MSTRDYSEEDELQRYVWNNYGHLQTSMERRLYMAAILELKARQADKEGKKSYCRSRPDYWEHPDVSAIANKGIKSFEQAIIDRILREYVGQIFINRCRKCDKIVASPIACTCLWCGFSWYERRAEMEAQAHCEIYPPNTEKSSQGH